MDDKNYLFESFLPYRKALNLGRMVWGGLHISLGQIKRCQKFDETFVSGVGVNARSLFPGVRPAGESVESFTKILDREARGKAMTPEESSDYFEKMADDLRRSIDEGTIDIWDDTPRYIDGGEVGRFWAEAWEECRERILPSLNPDSGLLAKLVTGAGKAMCGRVENDMRGYRAGLVIWDFARMHYEGEPPYRVIFSPQVAEALGVDPELESIKLGSMPAPRRGDLRRMEAAMRTVRKFTPDNEECLAQALQQAGIKTRKTFAD